MPVKKTPGKRKASKKPIAKKLPPVRKDRNKIDPDALPDPLLKGRKKFSSDNFFDSVFQVARLIPKGRVSTYGAIAGYLGTKLSARMVGWAMNAAGTADPAVPAHRVINRNGMLSGKHHFGTPTLMEELLQKEKIKVENDKVVDFDTLFWDPAIELI